MAFNINDNENIRNFIIYVAIIVSLLRHFIYSCIKPHPVTAYIKIESAKICHKANPQSCYKEMEILEPIKVYRNLYKSNGYLKTKNGDYIKETSVTYEGTKEYNYLISQKEKEEKIAIEERKREIEKAAHFFEANFIEIFSHIDLEYFYDFYIDPIGWQLIPYQNKKLLMQYCAMYAEYKKGRVGDNLPPMVLTRILNNRNGEILGKYDTWKGYIFK